jgi:DNA-binding transcriptional LysR family regulator
VTPTDQPTAAELAAWDTYLKTGSMKRAAVKLGVHEITVRKRIAALRDLYNVTTNAQLADVLARRIMA